MGGVEGGAPHGGSCFLDMTARASEVHDGRSLWVGVLGKEGKAGQMAHCMHATAVIGIATWAKCCHEAHRFRKTRRILSPVKSY